MKVTLTVACILLKSAWQAVSLRSTLTTLLLAPLAVSQAAETKRPNVIILLADDLGYADLGCQGSAEVRSPHIDSIAAQGVRCTAGYVTAPQCCPSRAGLMTGRYQNRFGFEANWPGPLSGKAGLPVSERTIADRLKAAGYVTGMVGKWHLGESEAMRPYNRGFDETFWNPNGGILFPDKQTGFLRQVYRGAEPVEVAEYSTDAFGREAAEFIERHQREPFFLYLAFVPPHWPMEAKPEHLAQFTHIRDLHRRTMLAMMAALDENVGRVLTKLRETKLEENTLVFFLSDNGGPTGKPRPQPDADFEYGQNTSKNDPCRGVKGDVLEGGIRVPFLVQWKGRIPAGKTCAQPVISLDILPTALAAAGVDVQPDWKLDGANLLPFLTGEKQGSPHDTLYWRFRFPPNQPALYRWAIRQGDWKLVKNDREPVALYHLATDIGETNNLAAEQPDRVAALQAAWQRWDAPNREPLWTEPRVSVNPAHHAKVQTFAAEIRMECTGNDPQLLLSDIPSAATGPFTLELKIKSTSKGPGQIFWSTAAKPEFVAAQCVNFEPQHDGQQWHDYTIALPAVTPAVTHLRLDPGTAPGLVRIARLALKDADGRVVKAWIGDAALHAGTAPGQRPNILFILTEDQGAHLGCLGTAGLQTPHMDALARSGTLFRNAFVAYPVCSSSKACIYTGLHNHRTGLLNNTVNYHMSAGKLTPAQRKFPLYVRNRIAADIPTLTERLRDEGYYQGVTHKLHVAPVEKFPYDEFLPDPTGAVMQGFLKRAAATGKPWFFLYNIPDTHRPYPNSDHVTIRVQPGEVKLPAFLPDTPVVRKDWAEYLAGIERADALVGQALEALRGSGQQERTIVVFLGDHGPTFQHGKMTPYDLGLRVPLVIAGPGIRAGVTSALASELDLMPTLLDLVGAAVPPLSHGISLRGVLEGRAGAKERDFVFAEISHRGNLPNDGMQERAIFDARWKLIYRENTEPPWRQVQADSKEWPKWGNRTYAETVRVKDQFPDAFRVLAGLDPQNLGGKVPAFELYDLQTDPDELHNLAAQTEHQAERDHLYAGLRQWVHDTADPAVKPPPVPPR